MRIVQKTLHVEMLTQHCVFNLPVGSWSWQSFTFSLDAPEFDGLCINWLAGVDSAPANVKSAYRNRSVESRTRCAFRLESLGGRLQQEVVPSPNYQD